MLGDRCGVTGLFAWDPRDHDPVLCCGFYIHSLKPDAVLLDQAECALPDEGLVYLCHERHNHVCPRDMGGEFVGRKCEDLFTRQECGELFTCFGKSLAAEEDFHRYLRLAFPGDQCIGRGIGETGMQTEGMQGGSEPYDKNERWIYVQGNKL